MVVPAFVESLLDGRPSAHGAVPTYDEFARERRDILLASTPTDREAVIMCLQNIDDKINEIKVCLINECTERENQRCYHGTVILLSF
jgi:hypothetical protein